MGDYDWISSLIGPAIQAGGTIAGQAASTGDNAQALALYKQLMAKYGNTPLPSQQQESPEYWGASALDNIKEDPAALASYTQADQSLGNIINGGGLTLADKANQAGIYQKLAQQNAHTQGNIRQDLQARGALNSGAGLAMQLQSQQQGSQQAADAAQQTAGSAQARAYQAIQSRAGLASQRSGQEYQRAAAAAQARDAINQHNAGARNASLNYNNGLAQQQYANQLDSLHGQGSLLPGQANIYGKQATQDQNFYTGLGKAGSRAVQNYQAGGSSGSYAPEASLPNSNITSASGTNGTFANGGAMGGGINPGFDDDNLSGWV